MSKTELKNKLEQIIFECFKKAEEKKFKDLNFVFPKNKTVKQFFKIKIDTLYNLDEYSATFLSIHTKAKIALREFQQLKFEGAYLELLRLVLTLPKSINKKNLKSAKSYEKDELSQMKIGKEITIKEEKEEAPLLPIMKNTKLIKEGQTGKSITRNKNSKQKLINQLHDLEI